MYIGGRPLRTVPLTVNENLYALVLAAVVIPWGAASKWLIPARLFDRFAVDERPMEVEERFAAPMITSRRSSYLGSRSNLDNSSGL